MQAYGKAFARIYNLRWGWFAKQVAPQIQAYYEGLPVARPKTLLDVCCGAGQLAVHFLQQGYRVSGLDLSPAMLEYARQNAAEYVINGQAELLQADAAHFTVNEPVGLAVSTFDALNHLPDLAALRGCFQSVFAALIPGGVFIFDLNTRLGLHRWSNLSVDDGDQATIITRGVFDDLNGRATAQLTGYVRNPDGYYERFEELAYNTAFAMQDVRHALLETGFRTVHYALSTTLDTPIEEPESEGSVFFVAHKSF